MTHIGHRLRPRSSEDVLELMHRRGKRLNATLADAEARVLNQQVLMRTATNDAARPRVAGRKTARARYLWKRPFLALSAFGMGMVVTFTLTSVLPTGQTEAERRVAAAEREATLAKQQAAAAIAAAAQAKQNDAPEAQALDAGSAPVTAASPASAAAPPPYIDLLGATHRISGWPSWKLEKVRLDEEDTSALTVTLPYTPGGGLAFSGRLEIVRPARTDSVSIYLQLPDRSPVRNFCAIYISAISGNGATLASETVTASPNDGDGLTEWPLPKGTVRVDVEVEGRPGTTCALIGEFNRTS